MRLSELITVIIATYAAIVSTFSVAMQFYTKTRRLKVTSYNGIIFDGSSSKKFEFFIAVSNVGHVPVVIQIPNLVLNDNKKLIFAKAKREHGFPHELKPGHSTKIWISALELENKLKDEGYEGVVKVVPSVSDVVGKVYKSKKTQKLIV